MKRSRATISHSIIQMTKTLHMRNVKPAEISKDVGISLSTVYKIIGNLKDNDMDVSRVCSSLKKPGPKPHENINYLQGVGQAIQNDPCYTQKGIAARMSNENIIISQSSVCNTLKKLGLSRKRVKKVADKTITPQLIAQRRAYSLNLRTIPMDKLFFLDETGFNFHTSRNYGYSPINVPCNSYVPANRGRNVSFLMMINNRRILNSTSLVGSYNSERFLEFIVDCVEKGYIRRDNFIVMDNCRIHKTSAIVSYFERNNFNILYLPPYSPQLNPIEEVFSLVKSKYHSKRPKASNAEEIQCYVNEVIMEINQGNIQLGSYYDHMQHYLDLAFMGNVFD